MLSLAAGLYCVVELYQIILGNLDYKRVFRTMSVVVISMVFYFISIKVMLEVVGVNITEYLNADKIGLAALLAEIPNNFYGEQVSSKRKSWYEIGNLIFKYL